MKRVALCFVCVMFVGVTGCQLMDSIKNKSKNLKLSSGTRSQSSEKTYTLPFGVKVGNQKAVVKNDICAEILKPVDNDAKIIVDTDKSDQTFINVFPCEEDGSVSSATKARSIIIIPKGKNRTHLNDSTEKITLPSGVYMMNIVSQGNTARVMFKID